MEDARFKPTQGSSPGGGTGFDYFGAAPTAPAPGPSPFGAPPGPTQFGGPPQSQFGGPMTYSAPPPPVTRARRHLSRGARVLLVFFAVMVAGGGWRFYQQEQHNRPLVMPVSINGQGVFDDPKAQSIMGNALQKFRDENPSIASNAQIYGSLKSFTLLLAARGHIDVQKDMVVSGLGPAQAQGDMWCAAAVDQSFIACERSQNDLTVLVMTEGTTMDVTQSLVDPAYAGF